MGVVRLAQAASLVTYFRCLCAEVVDRICYPALPYGYVDEARMPFSDWCDGSQSFSVGQVRILAHPFIFMQQAAVHMFTVSSDPTFQASRLEFQAELHKLLSPALDTPAMRQRAAMGICGGWLPSWWTSDD